MAQQIRAAATLVHPLSFFFAIHYKSYRVRLTQGADEAPPAGKSTEHTAWPNSSFPMPQPAQFGQIATDTVRDFSSQHALAMLQCWQAESYAVFSHWE